MRLLSTSTLKLCEFHDDEIPDYAILSHTWEDGEVSFQEMDDSSLVSASAASDRLDEEATLAIRAASKSKCLPGYTKITQCCRLAASEGWSYVWIDTCCIDKTSSAELSEAINSMYRWYEEAQVCYVYMTDVSSAFLQAFEWSRWFTRGWTLQELLAPSTVVFYDKEWIEIGTRWSLRAHISRATGMTYESMIRPKDSSVATKMSWASKRKTTRVEDIAYCLMGLFDINMPLLYGEGQKAFGRLQYEILLSRDDDESIFAWRDAGLSSSGMFARSPAAFAGSGDIRCVRNPNPRACPPIVTKTLVSLEGLVPTTNSIQKASLVTFNCVQESIGCEYVTVEVKMGSSGYYVRSSPGKLVSSRFLRCIDTDQLLNIDFFYDTFKMSLNYTEHKLAKDSKRNKHQTVMIPTLFGHGDGLRKDSVFQLTEAYMPYAWFMQDSPLNVPESGVAISAMTFHKDDSLVDQCYVDGLSVKKIQLHSGRPISALMFRAESRDPKNTETFAVILTATDASPSIDVVVPSPLSSLSEIVKPHLESLKENRLGHMIGREQGADQLSLPLQSRHRICVTLRKRIVEGDKVYCVHIKLQEDLALLRRNIYYP